jgi:hypothetical protein
VKTASLVGAANYLLRGVVDVAFFLPSSGLDAVAEGVGGTRPER